MWDCIETKYALSITPNTLALIRRGDTRIKTILSVPVDSERVNCSKEEIVSYYELLESKIKGVPLCLIFNLDEVGYMEFQDTVSLHIVVPNYVSSTSTLPVNRGKRRFTILHCIFADGSLYKSMIIMTRKTVPKEVFDIGFTPATALFGYQTNIFMSNERSYYESRNV